jgi:hypothetical protein
MQKRQFDVGTALDRIEDAVPLAEGSLVPACTG